MDLQELASLIGDLRRRAQDYEGDLSQNEALTRYCLVDPLLRALG